MSRDAVGLSSTEGLLQMNQFKDSLSGHQCNLQLVQTLYIPMNIVYFSSWTIYSSYTLLYQPVIDLIFRMAC